MITPTKKPGLARPDETRLNDANINTQKAIVNDGVPRQPNDRDEAPDAQAPAARPDMEQAARDLAAGQVDTDMRGMRGVETVAQETAVKSDQAKMAGPAANTDQPLTPVERQRGKD